jgi:glycosyltransferase involved in cell wall biosynthesis
MMNAVPPQPVPNQAAQRVLIIAYYFPPLGGAGVQRTLKFVKYLPEFGWQPDILTVQGARTGPQDPSLLTEISANLAITRTPALLLPPRWPWRVRSLLNRWVMVVDEQIGWLPFARAAGKQLLKLRPPQAIYSTSAPYTAHLIARRLQQSSGLPWIADFRDPWFDNISNRFATPAHAALVKRLEKQVVEAANQIIVVSEPMRTALLERYPALSPSKVVVIPNGFDPADFVNPAPVASQGRFLIVHNGSFYARHRTPEAFLQGLRLAIDQNLLPLEKVCVRFVGDAGKALPGLVSALNLETVVETTGYLPHHASLAHLLAADLLLLVVGSGPGASGIATGKIYEYLAARKPILALASSGAAADIIQTAQAGVLVDPDDPSAIAVQLGRLFSQYQAGRLDLSINEAVLVRFDRRQLTGRLAQLLTDLCQEKSAHLA